MKDSELIIEGLENAQMKKEDREQVLESSNNNALFPCNCTQVGAPCQCTVYIQGNPTTQYGYCMLKPNTDQLICSVNVYNY